jgi:hypothetical protein
MNPIEWYNTRGYGTTADRAHGQLRKVSATVVCHENLEDSPTDFCDFPSRRAGRSCANTSSAKSAAAHTGLGAARFGDSSTGGAAGRLSPAELKFRCAHWNL